MISDLKVPRMPLLLQQPDPRAGAAGGHGAGRILAPQHRHRPGESQRRASHDGDRAHAGVLRAPRWGGLRVPELQAGEAVQGCAEAPNCGLRQLVGCGGDFSHEPVTK